MHLTFFVRIDPLFRAMDRTTGLLTAGVAIFILMKSCVYHDFADITTSENSDQSLYNEIKEDGYVYFQNGNLLSPADASPHGPFRLRFNSIAVSSLDSNGELPLGGKFKEGSLIVKEVYQNNNIAVYAVMKRAPSDGAAGNGWLWSEYALDGTPLYSIQREGVGCIDCHSDTPNRDLVRTFDLH